MTNEDVAVTLANHDNRIKVSEHRIEDLEESQKQMYDLTISVKELAMSVKSMVTEQKEQSERIKKLEEKEVTKDEEIDKILGLELGADDYITKPFSVRELMARIKANLRKVDVNAEQFLGDKSNYFNKIIVAGELVIDIDKIEARVRGKVIDLTLREFEVLKFLASHKRRGSY